MGWDLSNLVYHFVAYINSEHKTLEKHSGARLFYLSSDSFSFDSFSSLPLLTSAFPSVRTVRSLTSKLPSIISPFVPCSKCLTSWHQIRKCFRHCLRFAYAHTSVVYAHILSYAELTLAYAHQSFAYALARVPFLNEHIKVTQGFRTWVIKCPHVSHHPTIRFHDRY